MKARNPNKVSINKVLLISSIACLTFGSAVVQADDIEIYLTPPADPVPPNVLFVLDESGSMDTDGRLEDLKEAMRGILTDDANENINAAILAYTLDRYDNTYWDSVRAISGFTLLGGNNGGNGDDMADDVDDLEAESGTPSVKALSDAVEWFKSGFTDTLHNIGDTSNTYPSPLAGDESGNWCKPNHIVFLTDGRPNSNNPSGGGWPSANWAISQYSIADNDSDPDNDPSGNCDATSPTWAATTITNDTDDYEHKGGLCAGEIAKWANETDLKDWQEQQNIITHTIGFDIGAGSDEEDFLVNIAETMGGGSYYPASDAASLTEAFNSILQEASTSIPYTYSSPTIPYNPDNAAVSDNFLYVPMFSPLVGRYWKGNLKKYKVGLDSNGELTIKDRNGDDVVNDSFLFETDTQDYWTSVADSGQTYYGGAVSNMSSTTERNLYTWLESNSRDLTATIDSQDPDGNDVTISPNRVHTDNIAITEGMVGASGSNTANKRRTYLRWANWIGDRQPSGETYSRNDSFPALDTNAGTAPDGLREYMGAPIHSEPAIARYQPAIGFSGSDDVDRTANSITFDSAHPWVTGDLVRYNSGGNNGLALEGGGFLVDGGEYYVISVDSITIKLANSDAADAVAIDLANAGVNTGEHSITTRNAIDVVLLSTSEGVLHAFYGGTDTADTAVGDGGRELWSFMPRQFLNKIKALRTNADRTTPDYGLDGPLTVYESGGKKYAAMTMRRGGRNIYVLDITDINKPKMAWEIIGGSTTGFGRLGQTWSKTQFLRMELNGAGVRDVVIFGGGYDNTTQDPAADGSIPASRVDDTRGNAIYVVDAATGARLAYFTADTTTDTDAAQNRLQITGMENGIIGILPVDINNNGITDRLYASGVGGRIFRIDIPDNGFSNTTIKGGMIADINSNPGNSGFQRFFNAPEVAYYSRGGVTFLGILIGSGYRPSPLDNTTTDRFYMIKDFDAFTVPSSYSVITEGGLYDATANLIQEPIAGFTEEELNADPPTDEVADALAIVATAEAALAAKSGWFIDLLDGDIKQKVFSAARIFDSVILFSTYQGQRNANSDVCLATTTSGQSYVYALNLLDGTAVLDLSNAVIDDGTGGGDAGGEVGVINAADRRVSLNIPGLPPTPVIVFPDPGTGDVSLSGRHAIAIVGLEAVFRFPDRFFPVNWEEVIDTTPVQTQ